VHPEPVTRQLDGRREPVGAPSHDDRVEGH
jgi:hypothetical protein